MFGLLKPFLEIFSSKKFSRVVVYCSVIKVPVVLSSRQLWYFIKSVSLCQELFLILFSNQLSYISIFHACLSRTFLTIFYSFFKLLTHRSRCVLPCFQIENRDKTNGEGGIWTLAPLLTTYSLSRGAPSASLGTSPKCPLFNIHDIFLLVQYFL